MSFMIKKPDWAKYLPENSQYKHKFRKAIKCKNRENQQKMRQIASNIMSLSLHKSFFECCQLILR